MSLDSSDKGIMKRQVMIERVKIEQKALVRSVLNPSTEEEIVARWKGSVDFPVVSICCITYNHEQYIEDALISFLRQETKFPVEILIHDDASTDRTPEIIRAYASKYPRIIKPIYQTENQFSKRISPNISFNFPRAKGQFIALCEGDDFWVSPCKLEKQVAALMENPDCVLCFHDAQKVNEKGELLGSMVPCHKRYLSRADLAKAPFIPTLTRMFRNTGFLWMCERDLPTAMDVCLAAYLSKFGGAVYLGNEVHSAYRVHSGGVWSLKNQCQKTRMTVDSRLYTAGHFMLERDDDIAKEAFQHHMSIAVTTIFEQLKFSMVLKIMAKYLIVRSVSNCRRMAVHFLSFVRKKYRSR